jgi:dTDP-glucose pyrophosphorylase/CBS domain-containing protein
MNERGFAGLFVTEDTPLKTVLERINLAGRISVALLVDPDQHLLAIFTDGDIRRGLLAGLTMDVPARELLRIKAGMPNPQVVTAPEDTPPARLLEIMQERSVRQLPLVDPSGRVVDIVLLSDFITPPATELRAVIMAGGFGTRMHPLTEDIPKPMLPIAGRPVMEWIVTQLSRAGIRHLNISTHYLPEKIQEHFGDGRQFGVNVEYVNEDRPLGTAGALGLIPAPEEPFLVINGDVITQLDFRKMLEYHQDHRADMTVAVYLHEFQIPYGVVECDGPRLLGLREKPKSRVLINAGIYLLQPAVYQYIPQGERFNMTDLIQWLLDAGRTVVSFPVQEYWLDMGQHADYAKAQKDVHDGRIS